MAAQAAAPFSLFPGRTSDVLDFAEASAVKLYNKAIEGLKIPYDLSPVTLHQFLIQVRERATAYGWEDVVKLADSGAVSRNMITDYGLLTIENCRTAAATYINAATRQAQNSTMLYTFLANSLTAEAHTLVFAFSEEFTLENNTQVKLGVGIMLLKTIIGKAVVDTEATVDTLRNSIATLDSKIGDLQSNVKLFNMHVVNVKNGLTARGEVVPELVTNLFRAYLSASDNDFVDYIKAKKFSHFDGTARETADSLMAKALAHYEASFERGTWNAPSAKDARIIALTAENAKLRGSNKRDVIVPKKGDKKTVKDAKNKAKWAWKAIPPTAGETTKVYNTKTYNWCPHHKAWTEHHPNDCTLKGQAANPNAHTPQMKVDPALSSTIDQGAESDGSED